MSEFHAIYLAPNKIPDVGVAFFKRDLAVGDLLKRLGIEEMKESRAFGGYGCNIEQIPEGHCIFLSIRINSAMDKETQRSCLQFLQPRYLYFSPMDGAKVSRIIAGDEDDEAYHSCNEGPPVHAHGSMVVVKTPTEPVAEKVPSTVTVSRRNSGKFKTPAINAATQPSISVGDKAIHIQQEAGPKPAGNERDSDEGSCDEKPNTPPKDKDRGEELQVPTPFTPPRVDLDEDMEYDQRVHEVWHSMKEQGFRTAYGKPQSHNLGNESDIYVLPEGRGWKEHGIENVEYFSSRSDFVRHVKRNPCILEDFDTVWTRATATSGWTKQWNHERTLCRFIFPVQVCGVSVDIDGTGNCVDFSQREGVHYFAGRCALHLHVLRFPYALQLDRTLLETLETLGWVIGRNGTCQYPGPRCEFVFADGTRKSSLTLKQVRQLLWTDPTFLYANIRCRQIDRQLSELRVATSVPADKNTRSSKDAKLDSADNSLRSVLEYIAHCEEVTWEHPSGDKGITYKVPNKDVPLLETHLKNMTWVIAEEVKGASEWWKNKRAYLPKWKYSEFDLNIVNKGKPTRKRFVPGLDIFWAIDDVLKYIHIYQNAPPADITKKPLTLRVDMSREDAFSHLLRDNDSNAAQPDDIALFARVYPELRKCHWKCVDLPSGDLRVERALIPNWRVDEQTKSIDLNKLARFKKGKDYFVNQQSVVKYLQAFGNNEVTNGKYETVKKSGALTVPPSELPYPIPVLDRKGNMVLDDELMAEARILHLIHHSQNQYINTEVWNLLLTLGWQRDVRVDEKKFLSQYVILPPWGLKKFNAGEHARQHMKLGRDVFREVADCIAYIKMCGIHEVSDSAFSALQNAGRSRRRGLFGGNDDDARSRCSDSTTATALTKNTAGTADSAVAATKSRDAKPKKTVEQATVKGSQKAAAANKVKEKSKPVVKAKAMAVKKDSRRKSVQVKVESDSSACSELNNESSEDENVEDGMTQESADVSSQEAEVMPYVDPYPFLSDEGHEGDIKSVLVSFNGYKFPQIKKSLEDLGWNFCVKALNSIQSQYVTLPPWTMESCDMDKPVEISFLIMGRDYVEDNRTVLRYIEKYGNRRVDDSEFVVNADGAGRRTRRAAAVPARVIPIPAAESNAFAVPKGEVKKRPAVSMQSIKTTGLRAQPSQKRSRSRTSSASSSASHDRGDSYGDKECDDITLSQVMCTLAEEEKRSPLTLPEVDRTCSGEIKNLLCLATTVPRLKLHKAQDVWDVLKKSHGWTSKYFSAIIGVEVVFQRPHVDLNKSNWSDYTRNKDYFCSESEVQAFIKDQVLARGRDYQTLVDRAQFTPFCPRCDDECSDEESSGESGDDDQVIVTHKLPRTGLYRCADDPYKTMTDNFDGASDCSDFEDDVPAYSVSMGTPGCMQDCDEDEPQVQGGDPTDDSTQPQSAEKAMSAHNKRRLSLSQQSSESRGSSNKKARRPDSLSTMGVLDSANKENAPAVQSLSSVIARVKEKLSPSYMPRSVVGRNQEFNELFAEVSDMLLDQKGSTILVAGQPGQGKTLTTKWVLKALEKERELEQCPDFHSTWCDGSTIQGGFRELCRLLHLTPQSTSDDSAKTALRERLLRAGSLHSGCSTKSRRRDLADEYNVMQIVVVDEIDMLPKPLFSFLKSLAECEDSNLILIGLANDSSGGEYVKEIIFEVYQELDMKDILLMLTDNLLDDNAVAMIVKSTSSNGDIRPMTTLANRCVLKAEELLTAKYSNPEDAASLMDEPTRPIVTLAVVNQCRSSSVTKLVDTVKAIPAGAKNLIVALTLHFDIGQTFSLAQGHDALNTYLQGLSLPRADMASLVNHAQQLLEHSLLNNQLPGSRASAKSTLANTPPQKSIFSLGVSANELVDQCSSELVEGAIRELQMTIRDRSMRC